MRLLVDTHALLWWAVGDPKLSRRGAELMGDASIDLLVSAATAWEIATKVRLGKLTWPASAGSVRDYVAQQGFSSLPVTLDHAERAGALPGEHRDPFDRMLIAQAHAEGVPIVSIDEVFDQYGVTRCW